VVAYGKNLLCRITLKVVGNCRTVVVPMLHTYIALSRASMVQVHLPAELRSPQHAVQLETGRYVITQHDSVNCVCIVDSEGQIQAHYQGSRPCRDRRPGGLAISRRDKYVPRVLAESREVWAGGTPTFQEICISANPKFNFYGWVHSPLNSRVRRS